MSTLLVIVAVLLTACTATLVVMLVSALGVGHAASYFRALPRIEREPSATSNVTVASWAFDSDETPPSTGSHLTAA